MKAKNLFIIFYGFASVTSGMSQSFTITSNTKTDTADCGTLFHSSKIYISNPSATDLELSYTVISNTMPSVSCWEYQFCDWHQCKFSLPSGTITPPIPILAHDSSEMKLEVKPGNNKGQGSLEITIFVTDDPSDFKTVTWNMSGCLAGATCVSGVSDIINNSLMTLSPNPAEDFINVEFANHQNSHGSIGVYSIIGEKLMEHTEITRNSMRIDLQKLPAGGYFIKYNSEEGVSVKKFLKTN